MPTVIYRYVGVCQDGVIPFKNKYRMTYFKHIHIFLLLLL